jgi:RNA-directed DNA polymerase
MEELAPYMRGWRSYFGFCETPEVLICLIRWVRFSTQGAFVAAVENTAPSPSRAIETGGSSAWHARPPVAGSAPGYLARAKALSVGLNNEYLKSLGLPPLFEEVSA